MAKTETLSGRYLVNSVSIGYNGKRGLQAELDAGYFQGWTLREIITTGKRSWILVVWDRERV